MTRSNTLLPLHGLQTRTTFDGVNHNSVETWLSGSNLGCYRYVRTNNSTNTANYRTVKKKRNLPFHPYRMHERTVFATHYVHHYDEYTKEGALAYLDRVEVSNAHFLQTYLPIDYDAVLVGAQQLARNRFVEKLTGGMDMNIAQAIAERNQTVRLIAETTARVAHGAKALKNGRPGIAAAIFGGDQKLLKDSERGRIGPIDGRTLGSKDFANQWLSYKYGWKPLLSDIEGAIKASQRRVINDRIVIRASAKGQEVGTHVAGPSVKDHVIYFQNYTLKGSYVCESPMVALASSLGLTNPLLLAWELLPYSFVVDWFLPVGDYLQHLHDLDGWSPIGALAHSTKLNIQYHREWNESSQGTFPSLARWNYYQSGSLSVKAFTYNVWQGPLPEVAPPSFKTPITDKNALDRFLTGFSLLRVLFRR